MAMLQSLPEFFVETKRLLSERRYTDAQKRLDAILSKQPRHPDFLALAGTCHVLQGNHGTGIALLERSLDMGCKNPDALMNLGSAYAAEGNTERADFFYGMALDQGESASLYAALASRYAESADPHRAIELCNKALAKQPDMILALFNRSIAYLASGQWSLGFEDYHKYSRQHQSRARRIYDLPNRPCPEWDGTADRTIATYGEQGLGDEIMLASCIPDLIRHSKKVIVECDERIEPLFRRSFPDAFVYGTTGQEQARWPWHHSIDASIPMGGLPQFFRKQTSDFSGNAFLHADEWQVNRWKQRLAGLGPGPKIGISWIGGTHKTRSSERSIPLDFWGPILSQPCKFVSLQWQEEADKEARDSGITIFPEAVDVFDFGASLVMACDLIISVTNTNVHLAGALGKQCLCLTPQNPAWPFNRHRPDDANIWYGSVNHIRQTERGEWKSVIVETVSRMQWSLGLKEAAE